MINFNARIEKYDQNGEKSGWTYVTIPMKIAQQLNPGIKKGYRVKGKLDSTKINGVSLIPIGGGDFIIPLNKTIRGSIKKSKGELLKIQIEVDHEEKKPSEELILCLKDDPNTYQLFLSMPKSHQRYYSDWVNAAKTQPTKAKRIAKIMVGLSKGLSFGETMKLEI